MKRKYESSDNMKIFSGNANPILANSIASVLNTSIGQAEINRFSDGEIKVVIQDSVREKDIFIVQPTCAPVNDHLMELTLMTDAMYNCSAARITAVIPYFGYARQDRRPDNKRSPISAKVVASQLAAAGVSHVVTFDLHATQIQGFFSVPVDNLSATSVFLEDILRKYSDDVTIVSPDAGGVKRATSIQDYLPRATFAMINKRRVKDNEVESMDIIGDVSDKTCIIVDDMVDTAGTLCKAAAELRRYGAASVVAYITHPILSGTAIDKISNSLIDELVVTDSIPLSPVAASCPRIRVLSIASFMANVIHKIHLGESLSEYVSKSCGQLSGLNSGSPRPVLSILKGNSIFETEPELSHKDKKKREDDQSPSARFG